jgi:hypothetical protein
MNQEVTQEVQAEVTAPEQVATAAPESVDAPAPEQTEEHKASKTFTQEELDAAIGKRLAREQRKWEREQHQRLQESQQRVVPAENLRPDQFESTEAYAEALALQKAERLIAEREQFRQQNEVLETYHDKEEEARAKYDDFEQVAYNPNIRITDVMAQTIQASEIGPDVAYFLGSNPKEADRISRLQPFLQAKEIGKLEAKLASEPPKSKKTSNAPSPIAPVVARGSNAPAYDTTDPRSTANMSTSDWIAAERERQRKKYAANKR